MLIPTDDRKYFSNTNDGDDFTTDGGIAAAAVVGEERPEVTWTRAALGLDYMDKVLSKNTIPTKKKLTTIVRQRTIGKMIGTSGQSIPLPMSTLTK